eukprot:CAMPEP_0176195408 /NCGR_PEP_ID=MMETSP0121_2-20121125/6497_1 /TAXON_ID=160619 /ORGANISM="Kryptoperidinium foliaceum, Strain CCMP 1326" /LENGTH=171 /DNA_ID=CAMNT_0017534177 /DNA_START=419 /DNA_END=935 /DNA_ORIENTATION=-
MWPTSSPPSRGKSAPPAAFAWDARCVPDGRWSLRRQIPVRRCAARSEEGLLDDGLLAIRRGHVVGGIRGGRTIRHRESHRVAVALGGCVLLSFLQVLRSAAALPADPVVDPLPGAGPFLCCTHLVGVLDAARHETCLLLQETHRRRPPWRRANEGAWRCEYRFCSAPNAVP